MAITTINTIRIQQPLFDKDGSITEWAEQAYWAYVTQGDKTALMPNARVAAKLCGGRILQRTLTTDNKDSADETTWDVTTADKVLVSRVVTSATVTAPKDQWARALPVIAGTPGCKALADAITAAIA